MSEDLEHLNFFNLLTYILLTLFKYKYQHSAKYENLPIQE